MTIIEARMEGICGICNKKYAVGTRILKDQKTNKWVEANCLFPHHAYGGEIKKNQNYTNPKKALGGEVRDSSPPPEEIPNIEAHIEANLDHSIAIVKSKFKCEDKELADYVMLITEIMRQMSSYEISRDIARQKMQKGY